MGTIKTFEEMDVWKSARILANRIHEFTCIGKFSKDYKFKDQMNASSGSIMDNIAEGFERNGTREFIQFLAIAKGSAGEVRSQLHRALDRCYITTETFGQLNEEVISVSKQLTGLINYLNASGLKGTKFINDRR